MSLLRISVGLVLGFATICLGGCGRKPIGPADPAGTAGSGLGGSGVGGVGGVGSGGASGASGGGVVGAGGSTAGAGPGGASGGTGMGGAGGAASGAGGVGGAAGGAGGSHCATTPCTSAGSSCLPANVLLTCAPNDDGCFLPNMVTCASGFVCERYAPAACADPQWVAWPMPNGQVDVAAGAPNEMSFADNGDGTVTDNVTRLMWQQAASSGTFDFNGAVAFCDSLTLAGQTDWRLPSMIELTSIADLGRSNPAIDVTAFPDTPSVAFWSSTTWGNSVGTAESVAFDRGNARGQLTSTQLNVRCVR